MFKKKKHNKNNCKSQQHVTNHIFRQLQKSSHTLAKATAKEQNFKKQITPEAGEQLCKSMARPLHDIQGSNRFQILGDKICGLLKD